VEGGRPLIIGGQKWDERKESQGEFNGGEGGVGAKKDQMLESF